MMLAPGTADRSVIIYARDTLTGKGKTGLVAASLTCYYVRLETDNDATVAALTLSDLTTITDAHSDGGLKEIDSTNAKGSYRLDLSDAIHASGAWEASLYFQDAASNFFVIEPLRLELMAETDVYAISRDTIAADNAELMFDGTGYAGGTTKLGINLIQILGTTLTETAGQIAAAFKQFFDVTTPSGTVNTLTDTRAEPGQGAPAATASPLTKVDYLYKAWRNKSTQTSTAYNLFDDAGTTVDQKSTDSDNGTTATKGEVVSGP